METRKVLEHTCFQKEHPLSPVRCRCRKYVSVAEADKLIAEGTAQYIVKSVKSLTVEEVCRICSGTELKKSCPWCNTTGTETITKKIPVYGEDIITTVGEIDPRTSKTANTTAKKTPRSPTIESNHILRSVGAIGGEPGKSVPEGSMEAAVSRIEEYEMLTLKERISFLVLNFDLEAFEAAWRVWLVDTTQEFPLALRYEPVDNRKTMQGRRFDYGRSV